MSEPTPEKKLHPSRRDLTQGDIKSHMLRLAIPMGWGIMALISFSLVDTWFISRLGTDQLAAIGFAMPVTMFVFNVVFSLSIAMSSVTARKIGEGEREKMRDIVSVGLVMGGGAALGCAIIGTVAMRPLFTAMGAEGVVYDHIRDYLLIWLYGSVFLAIPVIANAAIRGAGDAISPAIVMTCMAVFNLILSPLLIFGLWGFPRLEMQGAALSTVIAYALSMLIALRILYAREKFIHLNAMLQGSCWRLAAKALLVIAVPVAMASMILPVLGGILNAWFAAYGAAAVAGFGVAVRLETFVLIPAMALGAGIGPLAGQNFGAGNHARMDEIVKQASLFCVGFGLIASVAMIVFAHPIAAMFTDDQLAYDFAVMFMQTVPYGYVALFYMQVMGSIFNAVGKPVQALILNVVKSFLLVLPLIALGRYFAGPQGMFCGVAMAHIMAGLIMLWMVRRMQRSCGPA